MDFDEFEELLSQQSYSFAEKIYTVSDFIDSANGVFDGCFPSILVEGEVSSFNINQQKYVFFDIKDGESSLSCFMMLFKLRQPIEDGMRVVVRANAKLTQWCRFSLTVQEITPRGEGDIKRSFEILKNKLEKEGLFLSSLKRPITKNPDHLAVISSVQAAGYADFIKILNERWGGIKITTANTQVQGLAAAEQIIDAINYFNQLDSPPEVIAIIRGGGSSDDLSAFNDEQLVRSIAASRVPIITGIGHETDRVLADFVADVSASTPSNAAQFLTDDKYSEFENLKQNLCRTYDYIQNLLDYELKLLNNNIIYIRKIVKGSIEQEIFENKSRIRLIQTYNPESVLKKGYAMIRGEKKIGNEIEIETINEIIKAEVKNVRSKKY